MDAPDEYREALVTLQLALRSWLDCHPSARLAFAFPPEDVALIANLNSVIELIGATEDARALLRHMDAATGHRATALLARAVLDAVLIKSMPLLPECCPFCDASLGFASDTTGRNRAPGPGAITICDQCFEVSVFCSNMSLRELSDEDRSKLPAKVLAEIERCRAILRSRKQASAS